MNFPVNRIPNTLTVSTPEEAFLLYIDSKIVNMIVKYTNKEGKRGANDWKSLDEVYVHDA